MPVEKITFEYIKWRPKLCIQLQHIEPHVTNSIVIASIANRIQQFRLVFFEFNKVDWRWTPVGVASRYTSSDNELHDIPIHWQQAQQIKDMQTLFNK